MAPERIGDATPGGTACARGARAHLYRWGKGGFLAERESAIKWISSS